MQESTKKTLIRTTYDLIWENGIEGITIRKISNRVSLSSAALYRHFENLNQLLAYACIKFLEPCIDDYKLIELTTDDPLEISTQMWKVLANKSFYTPQIFSALFLSPYRTQLPEIIQDYYCIFDQDVFNVEEVLHYMKIIAQIFFQNKQYLSQHSPIYSNDEINILSDLTFFSYSGMLAILAQKEYPVAEVENMLEKFDNCLKHIYSKK